MEHLLVNEILKNRNAYEIIDEARKRLAEEAERRLHFYNITTEQEKAEFVNGEIIVHSPVRIEHNEATLFLGGLLNIYVRKHKLGKIGIEKVLIRLTRNDYEPDICFFGKEKTQAIKKGQTIFPPADFVVEILSNSTEERDRGIKFEDYAAHHIAEYWIIDAEVQSVEQYLLQNGQYYLYQKLHQGEIASMVIEGFKVAIKAIFEEEAHEKAMREMLNEE